MNLTEVGQGHMITLEALQGHHCQAEDGRLQLHNIPECLDRQVGHIEVDQGHPTFQPEADHFHQTLLLQAVQHCNQTGVDHILEVLTPRIA